MDGGGLVVHFVSALAAAVIGAGLALALRQPPILGYLLAGVAIGPFTPGFVGSTSAIAELAELGVVFLMFVIGVRLSLRELLRSGRVAIFGGLVQVGVTIALGLAVGLALGWPPWEAYAFGAVLSNSSSTVLSKVLGDRGDLDSPHGRLALAWSSVQDISTVALVAAFALRTENPGDAAWQLGRAGLFFVVLVPLGFFVVPWLLRRATAFRNREFFSLAVVTLALSLAALATQLGVSLALGAFLAGVVVGESDVAHRILGDAVPLRDVFSGIFFVSIGMLLDPAFLLRAWPLVLLAVALIVVLKGALSWGLARALGTPARRALLLAAALAQSGEFSFLLARIGLEQRALTESTFNLLLSAAVVSILLAPLVNGLGLRASRRVAAAAPDEGDPTSVPLAGHVVVCGYGRVGAAVGAALRARDVPWLVVEDEPHVVAALKREGLPVVAGDASRPEVLGQAHVPTASVLVLCMPDLLAVRRAAELARELQPGLRVLARVHDEDGRRLLADLGLAEPVFGEAELARELARRALEAEAGIAPLPDEAAPRAAGA